MSKENMFDEIFPGAKEKQIERAENLNKVALGKLTEENQFTVSLEKENCITKGLKELQTKKQMLREQLIDAVNNAQNNGLCVDLIHDELKSFAHEFIIVCENLEIDCDEIPF